MRPVTVAPNGGNAHQRRLHFRMFKRLGLRASARFGGAGCRVLEAAHG